MEKAIEVRGHAYDSAGGHAIRVVDVHSHSAVAAAVKAFARYAQHVTKGDLVNFYVEAPDTGEIVWFEDPVDTLGQAIDHVRDDQRESDPDLSAREAVDYARQILTVGELDNSSPVSFEAYRKVLQATPAELETIFTRRN